MDNFLPTLPTGQALFVFLLCLGVGLYVIIRYCLDQFDKPVAATDDKAPWNFVMPSMLTSRRQYLAGFLTYCGAIVLIFLLVSVVVGPGNFYFILKAIGAALTQTDLPAPTALKQNSLQDFPAFPIVIAFYIVGLNPTLPKMLNFEEPLRRLTHRLAYIPKNMDSLFNYMRFSQFDLPDDAVADAYVAAEMRRLPADQTDLKTIMPVFDRAVLLYADAGALAGDLTYGGADNLPGQLELAVFKQFRTQIQNVGVSLQGINSRLAEIATLSPSDRQKMIRTAQRDLNRNLEVLYVIFACASTVQDNGRVSDRLRAVGFSSAFPPHTLIPWDPIVRVFAAAAVVLLVAYEVAEYTAPAGGDIDSNVPSTLPELVRLLVVILFIHAFAIGQAITLRARLIASDRYFSETGRGTSIAYARIAFRCWLASVLLYVGLNLDHLVGVLLEPSSNGLTKPAQVVLFYAKTYLVWGLVPACCGAATAYAIDRPSVALRDRIVSTAVLGLAMGVMAVIAVKWLNEKADWPFMGFNLVVYGGLGCVIGYLLPAALWRYWRAVEEQMPEQISLLRANVLQYFHDVQQFNEWLNTVSPGLEQRRPLDVLAEDGGLQRLMTYVGARRTKIAPRAAA